MVTDDRYTFALEIDVRDYELDSEGIVNNANYLHYMEHTRHAFCIMAGFSFIEAQTMGIKPVVRRIEANYLHSLRGGDVMVSKLWVERQGARFIFHQDIYNKATGEHCLEAQVTTVCVEGGKLSRGDRMARAFKKYLTTTK